MMLRKLLLLGLPLSSLGAVTVGTGSSFVIGPNVTVVGEVSCSLSDGTTGTCLKVTSIVQVGPLSARLPASHFSYCWTISPLFIAVGVRESL